MAKDVYYYTRLADCCLIRSPGLGKLTLLLRLKAECIKEHIWGICLGEYAVLLCRIYQYYMDVFIQEVN